MNILVFSWRDIKHPLAGGAEQVDHEHHKGWIEAGHNVTLFTSFFIGGKKNEDLDGVKVIRRGNQILGVHFEAFFWYLFQKHDKFDLVVDEFHGIPFFTPLYINIPKLAVLQEVAREVWFKNDLHFPINYLVGYIGYFLEPLIFLFYRNAVFMVGSNSAKVELNKVGIPIANIRIIPHGVVLALPKKIPKKEKINTIIYLGALAKDKGIEDAIKTFGILNRDDKWQFWIVGKGGNDYVKKLKDLCFKFGIEKNTKFWGFVSQQRKFELLAKSHIMINPSLLEGFGLVNIEANVVGTPVVAYNSPGLVDSVKDGVNGIIVAKNDPVNLALSLKKLIENPKVYTKLSKTAKEWVKNFSWNTSGKLSLALIEEISLKYGND